MPCALGLMLLLGRFAVSRGEVFTVPSAVEHARYHNPELVAARLAVAVAEGRRQTAGRLRAPEVEGELRPNVQGIGQGTAMIGLNQSFPLTRRLRREREVSDRLVLQAEADVREAERRLAGDVRLRCVELLAVRRQLAVQQRQIENSRELAAWAARTAGAAEGSVLETAQLEFDYHLMVARRQTYQNAEVERRLELAALLGLSESSVWDLEGELAPPTPLMIPDPRAKVLPRSDYQAARARVAVAQAELEVARASRWGDASFGLAAEEEREGGVMGNRMRNRFLGLRFSVPLPLKSRAVDGVPQALATVERTGLQAEAVAARVRTESALAWQQMRSAERLASAYENELLPAARRLEAQWQTWREAGQGSLGEVLRARERQLQLEMAWVEAIRDFHLAQARWQTAAGAISTDQP